MKKRGVIKNIVGLLLTGLIVFAGIAIPSALLDWQVQSIVGGITNITVNERSPVGVSGTYKPHGETDTSDATPTPATDLDSLSWGACLRMHPEVLPFGKGDKEMSK